VLEWPITLFGTGKQVRILVFAEGDGRGALVEDGLHVGQGDGLAIDPGGDIAAREELGRGHTRAKQRNCHCRRLVPRPEPHVPPSVRTNSVIGMSYNGRRLGKGDQFAVPDDLRGPGRIGKALPLQ